MKSARRIFRAGFTCPYIVDEIRPQKIFGQALPVLPLRMKIHLQVFFGQVAPAPTVEYL